LLTNLRTVVTHARRVIDIHREDIPESLFTAVDFVVNSRKETGSLPHSANKNAADGALSLDGGAIVARHVVVPGVLLDASVNFSESDIVTIALIFLVEGGEDGSGLRNTAAVGDGLTEDVGVDVAGELVDDEGELFNSFLLEASFVKGRRKAREVTSFEIDPSEEEVAEAIVDTDVGFVESPGLVDVELGGVFRAEWGVENGSLGVGVLLDPLTVGSALDTVGGPVRVLGGGFADEQETRGVAHGDG